MAAPRNPFGGGSNVIPFNRGVPLGEGGGGGFRPPTQQAQRPPNRFQEIMRGIDEQVQAKHPAQAQPPAAQTQAPRKGGEPATLTAERERLSSLFEKGYLNETQFRDGLRRNLQAHGLTPKKQPSDSFMERRQGQLREERVGRATREQQAMDAEHARLVAQDAARKQAAEAFVKQQSGPQKADRLWGLTRRANLGKPKVNDQGLVSEWSGRHSTSVFTDPLTGVTRLRQGSRSKEFKSRQEALEALDTGTW